VYTLRETAQTACGFYYAHGICVEKNLQEIVRWYRLASNQKFSSAQYNLGVCYSFGQGVQRDVQEAVRWYRAAALQNDADASMSLASCYRDGRGVAVDRIMATCYSQKAAELGNVSALNGTNLSLDLSPVCRLVD
jgi:TPR repeat protein